MCMPLTGCGRCRMSLKNSDLSDVSKPLKSEKKNALADIDMNNYASEWPTQTTPMLTI